jgi:hypothetical protein
MEAANPIFPSQPLARFSRHASDNNAPAKRPWPRLDKGGLNWISCEFSGGSRSSGSVKATLAGAYVDDFYRHSLLIPFAALNFLGKTQVSSRANAVGYPKTALNLVSSICGFRHRDSRSAATK